MEERYKLTDKGKNILKKYLNNLEPTKCRPDFIERLNERIKQIDKGESNG